MPDSDARREEGSAPTFVALPSVSVVIPVRNEVNAVIDAINSALDQRFDGSLEVVVADGASTDGTPAVIRSAFAGDSRVVLVDNPVGKTAAGLNAAIRASSGEVVVRCDAHSVLPEQYVADAVAIMRHSGADVVGGRQHAVGGSAFERAVAAAMASPMGAGGANYRTGSVAGPTDTVYLGVFRRSVFERIGLFDESLRRNQDYELNQRVRSGGGTVYFDPDLAVKYTPRSTPGHLWGQYWEYGAWKREVLRRDLASLRWRQVAAPALVVGLAASAALALRRRRGAAAVLPSVYAGALGIASLREVGELGLDGASRVALAFATMHLGWGLGFFLGTAHGGQPQVSMLEIR